MLQKYFKIILNLNNKYINLFKEYKDFVRAIAFHKLLENENEEDDTCK